MAEAMWTYDPDLLARRAPRYTSYPTAAQFGDHMCHADMAAAFDAMGADDGVFLYLHIPYCRTICWYCGCIVLVTAHRQRVGDPLQLCAQVDAPPVRRDQRHDIEFLDQLPWPGEPDDVR